MTENRNYEIVLIFDSGLDDEQVDQKLKRLEERVTEDGGSVEDVAKWGKRKLAYPIKKKESGNYVVVTFKSKATQLEELERGLKLDEQVLRYLIIVK
jgi:small subunit ribosomal protein S6